MLKRVFLTFLTCIIAYSIFIFLVNKHLTEFRGAQNMWQENIIRMQDYMYSGHNYPSVLLGSSLTMRIVIDRKDRNTFNLAAGGGDPLIGLEILKRSKEIPKVIFIESNFVLTKKIHDQSYLNTLYMPGFYEARKFMPIFKDQYQPINFLGQGVLFFIKKITLDNLAIPNSNVGNTVSASKELKLRMEKIKYESNNFLDIQKTINVNTNVLQSYIDYFAKKGVLICFFEMPRHCNLMDDKVSVYSRRRVNEIARVNSLKQIPLPSCKDYITSDGLHLNDESAIKYTAYFFKQAAKLYQK
jgi:hypothetical protein